MRLIRNFIYAVIGFLVLGLSAVFLIPKKTIATNAIAQLERQIGRNVEIGDDIDFSIFPDVAITFGNVRIANAEWSTEEPYLLRAQGFAIGIELTSVFSGPLKIKNLEARNANVFLHRSTDGQANWEFSDPESTASARKAGSENAVLIDSVLVKNSSFTFLDGTNDPLSWTVQMTHCH